MVNGRVVSRLKLSSVLSSPSTFSWLGNPTGGLVTAGRGANLNQRQSNYLLFFNTIFLYLGESFISRTRSFSLNMNWMVSAREHQRVYFVLL